MAEPDQIGAEIGPRVGDMWFLLAQIDAVATSIALVLEGVNLFPLRGENAAQAADRLAAVQRLEQADHLAGAAAALARLAQERVNELQALLGPD